MREMKRKNPEKNCFMEQDKLFVDGKIYVYSESEERVLEQRQAEKLQNKNEKLRYRFSIPMIFNHQFRYIQLYSSDLIKE